MALIKCADCGREISDKARGCPQCGCPMAPSPQSGKADSDLRDALVRDVTAADYGTREVLGVKFPTARKSVSGWVAIIVGAVLAGTVFVVIASTMFAFTKKAIPFGAALLFLSAFGGAWLGVTIHKAVRNRFPPSEK